MESSSAFRSELAQRYEILSEVGRGAAATVYAARDLRHDRTVAIKVLRPSGLSANATRRFTSEIRTVAALHHPHIVPLFDSGQSGGIHYFVMPLVTGETLRARLEREGELSLDESLAIGVKLAAALQSAHDAGVVHRDVKPANVLLTREGEPLITDFGVALATRGERSRVTAHDRAVGTPLYMSPEQLLGHSGVDGKADQFALACLVHEMLAGAPPFEAPSAGGALARLSPEAVDLTSLEQDVPRHMVHALARGLERLPSDRFAQISDFASALRDEGYRYARVASHAGQADEVATAIADRGSAKRRAGWAFAAAVVVSLMWFGPPWRTPPTPPTGFSIPLADLDANSGLTLAPDGRTLAFANTSETRPGIYLKDIESGSLNLVQGTEDGRYPSFSPDGAWLVFRGGSRADLMKVAKDGGAPSVLVPAEMSGRPSYPIWGQDGHILFSTPDGLMRVSELGGRPDVLKEDAWWLVYPRAIRGGTAVLFTDARDQSTAVLDLRDGSIRHLVSQAIDAVFLPRTEELVYSSPVRGLFRIPFDEDSLAVTGAPQVLAPRSSVVARAQFAVAASGTVVYAENFPRRAASPQRMLMDVVFGNPPTTVGPGPAHIESPDWSPDGRGITFAMGQDGRRDIYVFDVANSRARRITVTGDNTNPNWAPDASAILFSSLRGSQTTSDLYVRRLADDDHGSLIHAPEGPQTARDWPLDNTVVFESGIHPTSLWVLNLESLRSTEYLSHQRWDFDDLAISPDGNWAAYQSDEHGEEAVFLRSFPEPGPRVRVSRGPGQFPRWSPDGVFIYYWLSENEPLDSLVAAQIQFNSTPEIVQRSIVLVGDYEPEHWDLHPTDRRRAVVTRRLNAPQNARASNPGQEHLRLSRLELRQE